MAATQAEASLIPPTLRSADPGAGMSGARASLPLTGIDKDPEYSDLKGLKEKQLSLEGKKSRGPLFFYEYHHVVIPNMPHVKVSETRIAT